MPRVRVGDPVPLFHAKTMLGEALDPGAVRGRKMLLSFRRYAACPVCNQHLATFRVRGEEIRAQGVEMIVIFHSSEERIRGYFDPATLPFAVIADPQFALYEAFGVAAIMRARFKLGSLAAAIPAARRGFGDLAAGSIDGTPNMVPANFMLEGGRVVAAHYGRHLGDAWSIEQALGVIDELWSASSAAPSARPSGFATS